MTPGERLAPRDAVLGIWAGRRDLIWRYGIAREIMDPVRRTTEIGNWLRTVVAPRRV